MSVEFVIPRASSWRASAGTSLRGNARDVLPVGGDVTVIAGRPAGHAGRHGQLRGGELL